LLSNSLERLAEALAAGSVCAYSIFKYPYERIMEWCNTVVNKR